MKFHNADYERMAAIASDLGLVMSGFPKSGSSFAQSSTVQAKHLATSETTASAAYTDLTTVGPAITVTIGPQGVAIVFVTWGGSNTGGNQSFVSCAVSGGDTVAASDNNCVCVNADAGGIFVRYGGHIVMPPLTPGASDVFTLKYRVNAGTGTFNARDIGVLTY